MTQKKKHRRTCLLLHQRWKKIQRAKRTCSGSN